MSDKKRPEEGRPLKQSRRSAKGRGRRKRKAVDSDDVVEVVQIVAEEATGLGAAKRAGKKLQDFIARKYISEIERLEEKHELSETTIADLVKANAILAEGNQKLLDLLVEKDVIIAELSQRLDSSNESNHNAS